MFICLWLLKQEGTTLTFNFYTFSGENGEKQFLTTVNLLLDGNNHNNFLLPSLILQSEKIERKN